MPIEARCLWEGVGVFGSSVLLFKEMRAERSCEFIIVKGGS